MGFILANEVIWLSSFRSEFILAPGFLMVGFIYWANSARRTEGVSLSVIFPWFRDQIWLSVEKLKLPFLCCLAGSSLQEYGSLSGQSIYQTHLLCPGDTDTHTPLLGSLSCISGALACYVCPFALCVISQVSVPKDLVAVMSAMRDGQEADPQDNNRIIYRFRQPVSPFFFCWCHWWGHLLMEKLWYTGVWFWPQVPLPSYLIAIVVGNLESRYSFVFTDVIVSPAAGKQYFSTLIGWQGDWSKIQSLVWERVCG